FLFRRPISRPTTSGIYGIHLKSVCVFDNSQITYPPITATVCRHRRCLVHETVDNLICFEIESFSQIGRSKKMPDQPFVSLVPFDDPKSGVKPVLLMLRDYSADKIVNDQLAKTEQKFETFEAVGTPGPKALAWQGRNGAVSIRATLEDDSPLRRRIVI